MRIAPPLLALLVLAGCASPGPSNTAPAPTAEKQPGNPDKHLVLDPALIGSLRVLGVHTTTGADGLLKFQVDVENLSAAARTIIYQIDWLDRDGLSLGIQYDDFRWTLMPRETAPLSMTAPTPLARDFRLRFRPRGND
ncbi:MAG: YcfL family protein [Verrucomicrobiota bacterium]|jgi:uncharacterized protein YcfL